MQIIGAVIDVEFPRDNVPKVYDALNVDGTETTLEVQQQLGDGVVRTIAMGSTEGLKRGLKATNTGAPISVLWAQKLLAVSWTSLAVQSTNAPSVKKKRASIHRSAPAFDEQASSTALLETGIKLSTWFALR